MSGQPQRATRVERTQALRQEIIEHEAELAARGAQRDHRHAVGQGPRPLRRRRHRRGHGPPHRPAAQDPQARVRHRRQAADHRQLRGVDRQGSPAGLSRRHEPDDQPHRADPGVGDTPLWMSTELGGCSPSTSLRLRGDEPRAAVGPAGGRHEVLVRRRHDGRLRRPAERGPQPLFYGRSTTDKPVPAIIADAVDRSSILGWFGDVDRAVTMLSGNSVGIKPMMGAASPVQPRFCQVAGAVGGPAAGQAVRLLDVANDALSGHPTAQTYRDWRNLVPGQNLPYVDPLMDMLFEKDGRCRRASAPTSRTGGSRPNSVTRGRAGPATDEVTSCSRPSRSTTGSSPPMSASRRPPARSPSTSRSSASPTSWSPGCPTAPTSSPPWSAAPTTTWSAWPPRMAASPRAPSPWSCRSPTASSVPLRQHHDRAPQQLPAAGLLLAPGAQRRAQPHHRGLAGA